MLIDLHTHTRVHSACSALTPDALVRAARARGLDGVCLTEHDAVWPLDDVRRLGEQLEFLVLRGMEVSTDRGHVLVYGLDRWDSGMASLAELHRLVRAEGALMYLAHPARGSAPSPPPDVLAMFDSVEAHNGTDGPVPNETAARIAAGMRLPGIAASDCHSVREIGTSATEFRDDVHGEASFLAALRAGAYEPRILSP